MEYLPGGSLSDNLKKYGHMRPRSVQRFAREIMEGLLFLHSSIPLVVHRDIKPQNILLTHDGHCKLADFGTIKIIQETKVANGKFLAGTPLYAPPEMWREDCMVTPAFDVWSLGVTLYKMLTNSYPWPSDITDSSAGWEKKISTYFRKDLPEILSVGPLDIYDPMIDQHSQDLIESMLVVAEKRPTIGELMHHRFFTTEYTDTLAADVERNRYVVLDKLNRLRHGDPLSLTSKCTHPPYGHKNTLCAAHSTSTTTTSTTNDVYQGAHGGSSFSAGTESDPFGTFDDPRAIAVA